MPTNTVGSQLWVNRPARLAAVAGILVEKGFVQVLRCGIQQSIEYGLGGDLSTACSRFAPGVGTRDWVPWEVKPKM